MPANLSDFTSAAAHDAARISLSPEGRAAPVQAGNIGICGRIRETLFGVSSANKDVNRATGAAFLAALTANYQGDIGQRAYAPLAAKVAAGHNISAADIRGAKARADTLEAAVPGAREARTSAGAAMRNSRIAEGVVRYDIDSSGRHGEAITNLPPTEKAALKATIMGALRASPQWQTRNLTERETVDIIDDCVAAYKEANGLNGAAGVDEPAAPAAVEADSRLRRFDHDDVRSTPTRSAALERVGAEPTATMADVRRAYRASSLREHPDKVPADQREVATARFQSLSSAFQFLDRAHDEGHLA